MGNFREKNSISFVELYYFDTLLFLKISYNILNITFFIIIGTLHAVLELIIIVLNY